MKKPFVCGNWKLHHHLQATNDQIDQIVSGIEAIVDVEVCIAPVATVLFSACAKAKGSKLQIAAQNVFFEEAGAFTGEWSVRHLIELGCRYSIVGHSERRQYFNETNESVAKKAKACFEGGLTPIVCVGESLAQREQGQTKAVLQAQLTPVMDVLLAENVSQAILAYEPVWAIGTGKSATALEAEEVHLFLRDLLQDRFGDLAAQQTRIIYGGSVKPENTAELMSQKNIDGVLVGGASLGAESFLGIVQSVSQNRPDS